MKIRYFLSMLILCGTMACKKKNTEVPTSKPDEKKYAIQFDASGFTSEMSNMDRKSPSQINSRDSLKNYVNDLHYLVFDWQGNEVRYENQFSYATPNFGHISDSLSPGLYTVIFAAGNPDFITLKGSSFAHYPVSLRSSGINYAGIDQEVVYVKESFFKKIALTVNGDSLISNVKLDRIVGKVEIVITDAASTDRIIVTKNIESAGFSFDSAKCSYPRRWSEAMFSKVNDTTFSTFIANDRLPFDITIKAIVGSQVTAEKKLTNINVANNRLLKLSGKLFTGSVKSQFPVNVDVNDKWADTTVLHF